MFIFIRGGLENGYLFYNECKADASFYNLTDVSLNF